MDLQKEFKLNVINIPTTLIQGDMMYVKYCPKCDGELVIREGPYGEFYGCSNFPDCEYTQSLDYEDDD